MSAYIHYGSDHFDPDKFKKVKNFRQPFIKPSEGGLWASPVNAERSWKDWCESEDYEVDRLKISFTFELYPESKILEIKNTEDILSMMAKGFTRKKYYSYIDNYCAPDFEKIAKEYDAILFYENNDTHYPFYGWDCDSILVLNEKMIKI